MQKADMQSCPLKSSNGRDDRIRTCGLFVPNEARYQTVPHPVNTSDIITMLEHIVKHYFFTIAFYMT